MKLFHVRPLDLATPWQMISLSTLGEPHSKEVTTSSSGVPRREHDGSGQNEAGSD